MGFTCNDVGTASLISKPATTVTAHNGLGPTIDGEQMAPCSMLEHSECGSICQNRELQLPATTKTIYESWTLAYQQHAMHIGTQVKSFFDFQYLRRTPTTILDRIMFIEPNTQFYQKELAQVVSSIREQYKPKLFRPGNYNKDVERRLRNLDWTVQDELYKLIRDRTENSSNSFRRREYKLVVLLEVPGGEMTDARIDSWCNKLKRSKAPHMEYRVILRGHEVRDSADGWDAYDRYTQPWKLADEAVLENTRRKCGYQEILE